jgi:hypothetical protein
MPALPEARPLTLQASRPATHLERIQLDSLSAGKDDGFQEGCTRLRTSNGCFGSRSYTMTFGKLASNLAVFHQQFQN